MPMLSQFSVRSVGFVVLWFATWNLTVAHAVPGFPMGRPHGEDRTAIAKIKEARASGATLFERMAANSHYRIALAEVLNRLIQDPSGDLRADLETVDADLLTVLEPVLEPDRRTRTTPADIAVILLQGTQARNLRDIQTAFQNFELSYDDLERVLGNSVFTKVQGSGIRIHPEFGDDASGHNPLAPKTPELKPIFEKLASARPRSSQQESARNFGLRAIQIADQAYQTGDSETGNFYKTVATAFADIAIGFVPVVGVSRDIYELFVGKSLLTGEDLSWPERGLAAVGIVTGGVVSSIGKMAKAGVKISRHADEMTKVAKAGGEILDDMTKMGVANSDSVNALKKIAKAERKSPTDILNDTKVALIFRAQHLGLKFKASKVGFADDLNTLDRANRSADFKDSFRHGSKYIEAELVEPSKNLVRTFSSALNNAERSFVVHKDVIKGMTPSEIQKTLNLTYIPDVIVDVAVKSGSSIRLSQTAPIRQGFKEGIVQIEIRSQNIGQVATFSNRRAIGASYDGK